MRTWRAAAARLTLVVLLLCAVVSAQALSLESSHQESSSSHHCCGLCHAGMPFVRSAPAGPVVPVAPGGWVEKAWTVDAPHDVLLTAGSSRAPPVR
jgi:hypothetical protein